ADARRARARVADPERRAERPPRDGSAARCPRRRHSPRTPHPRDAARDVGAPHQGALLMRALALAAAIVAGCGGSSSGASDSSALPATVAQHTIDQLAQAKQKTALLECQQIVMAAEVFHAETNQWPSSVDALVESKALARPMKDPWDSAYELKASGDE